MIDTLCRKTYQHSEVGVVTLEIAILFGILLLLAAGVVDLGLCLKENAAMLRAAREGVEAAVRERYEYERDVRSNPKSPEVARAAQQSASRVLDESGYDSRDFILEDRYIDGFSSVNTGGDVQGYAVAYELTVVRQAFARPTFLGYFVGSRANALGIVNYRRRILGP